MSLACPNKNSKEWKTLVSQTGENLANLAFVANNFQMPDVKSATEIKKEIGYKKQMENYAGFSARLRNYNAKHGTSHSFTATKAWGNTFDIEMKYNYLPVNVEKQRQRMEARKEPLYVENLSTQSFKEVYPSQSKGSEQLNLFESDDLIANADLPITDAEKFRQQKLYAEVRKQKNALAKVSDINEEIKIRANIAGLQELIDIAEGRIITSQNIEGFEDVAPKVPKEGASSESSSAPSKRDNEVKHPVEQKKNEDETVKNEELASATGNLFKMGQLPSENASGPHIDSGSTLLKAMESFKPEQVSAMTEDTKKLIETQKNLMGMLSSMRPILQGLLVNRNHYLLRIALILQDC
jgi:hypothetical protein